MGFILYPILGLLLISYYFLVKNSKKYDKRFGVGSMKFVQGELTMAIMFLLIFVAFDIFYNFIN